MKTMIFTLLALAVSGGRSGRAADFSELKAYEKDQTVEGYRVESVYLDAAGEPMGARYFHANGMKVDILRFASVPQISVNVGALSTSENGAAHTQEHLVLGKGKTGQYMKNLIAMSLGDDTAATHIDVTNYQFNAASDKESFYKLFKGYMTALIRPDYTDEEIRREVAHLGAVQDAATGLYRLEERGTVYLEEISRFEKADIVNWHQLTPLIFGKEHPLARNQGGDPKALRALTPEDIRNFHRKNYHFGSNMALIAALPPEYSPAEFLARLNALMDELEPEAKTAAPGCRPGEGDCSAYSLLAEKEPVSGAPVVIGSFPGEDSTIPQGALFSWKPLNGSLTPLERLELTLFLDVLGGGDSSVLYKDLIDPKARSLDAGASGIYAHFDPEPAEVPMLTVAGISPDKLTEKHLASIRDVIVSRVRSVRKAGKKSDELKEFNRKALSLLRSWRRDALKYLDSPPRFGFRHSGIGWHIHLDRAQSIKGFKKDLTFAETYLDLEERLKKGQNVWKNPIKRAGLESKLIVSAVRPDKELLDAQIKDKKARLTRALDDLKTRFGIDDEQKALGRLAEEYDRGTAALVDRDKKVGRPRFTDSPPMTLDDGVDLKQTALGGRPAVVSRFDSTPFTDVYLAFNLRSVPKDDWLYLPVLEKLPAALGGRSPEGKMLDYAAFEEAWREEIYAMRAWIDGSVESGRMEFTISVSGANKDENVKALGWLKSILRPDINAEHAPRLRDLVMQDIKSYRAIFQGSEENWVGPAANAYYYSDDAQWMTVSSYFTRLHLLHRLYFRLAKYPDGKTKQLVETILDDLLKDVKTAPKTRMRDRLKRLASGAGLPETLAASRFLKEFGVYFDAEFAKFPEGDIWRLDMQRLISQTKDDLSRDPALEMEKAAALLKSIIVRSNVRAAMTGTAANTDALLPALGEIISALPDGTPAVSSGATPNLVLRRLKERLPGLTQIPVYAGLVNNDSKSGSINNKAPGISFSQNDSDSALDFLALQAFSGTGGHSLFMKTWGAGLAYSNGVGAWPQSGTFNYLATRCSDLGEVMNFVSKTLLETELNGEFFVDYALATAFGNYRGASGFSERGAAMAVDVADGRGPGVVRKFKEALIAAAKKPGVLEEIKKRLPRTAGSVIVGYGANISDARGAKAFAVGPQTLLDEYEKYMASKGIREKLERLYARDFWIFD